MVLIFFVVFCRLLMWFYLYYEMLFCINIIFIFGVVGGIGEVIVCWFYSLGK